MKAGDLEFEGKLTGLDAPVASGLAGGDITISGGVGAGSSTAPVGLENESILDGAISASTDGFGPAEDGRLNHLPQGWVSSVQVAGPGQWWKVDLGNVRNIAASQIQAGNPAGQWITTYQIDYSNDDGAGGWTLYNFGEILTGNTNGTGIVTNNLIPFDARYVRILPVTHFAWTAGRFEFLESTGIAEDGAIVITDVINSPPAVTTNKLYSVAGALTWNGIDVNTSGGIMTEDADNNIVAGTDAGSDLTPVFGDQNIIIGTRAGRALTTATGSVVIGYQALTQASAVSTGLNNIAIGWQAMNSTLITSANNNVGVGSSTLGIITTAANNVAIGSGAGLKITTGGGNVMLGKSAGPTTNQSNQLFIHNAESNTPLIHGDFSGGAVTVNGTLEATDGFTLPLASQTQTGTTYTAVLADADKMITLNNAAAITMTIPANSSVAYPIGTKLNFMQLGAGQVTVAITTDTLNVESTLTLLLTGQYAVATAFKVTATTWVLFGNLEAA